MQTKNLAPWAFALVLAVLASSQVLYAGGGRQLGHPAGVATSASSQPVKWQYMFLTADFTQQGQGLATPNALNSLGQQGWELVATLPEGSSGDSSQSVTNSKLTVIGFVYRNLLIFKKPL